jgi:hypothetical protein
MGLVAADPFEAAPVVATEAHLDAAVALAQDAGGLPPGLGHRNLPMVTPGDVSSDPRRAALRHATNRGQTPLGHFSQRHAGLAAQPTRAG